MPTTTNFSLPYPALSDEPNVPADMQSLAEAVDTALGAATPVPLRVVRSSKDSEGIWTTISWYREDDTLAMTSVLSGGTTPEYTTRTVTEYEADGSTVADTTTYTLSYDSDGDLESEVFA